MPTPVSHTRATLFGMADDDIVWVLGAVSREHGVNAQWAITDEERARLDASEKLLTAALTRSAYADLQHRFEQFELAVADAQAVFAEGPSRWSVGLDEMGRSVDALLSALRAFDDRTKHWLSRTFGDDAKAAFAADLSSAYDNNFAYRFCWKLRNYSQHCGNPVTSARGGASVDADAVYEPVFHAARLLEEYDSWGDAVRKDLRDIGGHFDVVPVIASVMAAVTWAYARLLNRHKQELEAAALFILHLAGRIEAPGEPNLVGVPSDLDGDTKDFALQVRALNVPLAQLVRPALEQAAEIGACQSAPS